MQVLDPFVGVRFVGVELWKVDTYRLRIFNQFYLNLEAQNYPQMNKNDTQRLKIDFQTKIDSERAKIDYHMPNIDVLRPKLIPKTWNLLPETRNQPPMA